MKAPPRGMVEARRKVCSPNSFRWFAFEHTFLSVVLQS